ncbi:hypothetical protein NDU88_002298 [Pleurodeles waltl]|uniref:Uncharacterized protein n=1 Tax=Pleurodeles waltl TaxID=8319 RepID=A0AAV7T2C2_PLEWA|nr:hypothetical protein NDU88_002298 [Pleurodeles waltl]
MAAPEPTTDKAATMHLPPGPQQESIMDCLQAVAAVSRWLEGMDSKNTELAAETIRSVTVGIQDRMEGLELRLGAIEECLNTILDRDSGTHPPEEQTHRPGGQMSRDNVHFFIFPEHAERADIKDFL